MLSDSFFGHLSAGSNVESIAFAVALGVPEASIVDDSTACHSRWMPVRSQNPRRQIADHQTSRAIERDRS